MKGSELQVRPPTGLSAQSSRSILAMMFGIDVLALATDRSLIKVGIIGTLIHG